MNVWERVTGRDLTNEYKQLDARAAALPSDYQAAWSDIKTQLVPYGDFSGRNLMPILDGVLGLLEETAAEGQDVHEVLGDDIAGFCAGVAGGEGAPNVRDRWRRQLNTNVARKLEKLGG